MSEGPEVFLGGGGGCMKVILWHAVPLGALCSCIDSVLCGFCQAHGMATLKWL